MPSSPGSPWAGLTQRCLTCIDPQAFARRPGAWTPDAVQNFVWPFWLSSPRTTTVQWPLAPVGNTHPAAGPACSHTLAAGPCLPVAASMPRTHARPLASSAPWMLSLRPNPMTASCPVLLGSSIIHEQHSLRLAGDTRRESRPVRFFAIYEIYTLRARLGHGKPTQSVGMCTRTRSSRVSHIAISNMPHTWTLKKSVGEHDRIDDASDLSLGSAAG